MVAGGAEALLGVTTASRRMACEEGACLILKASAEGFRRCARAT